MLPGTYENGTNAYFDFLTEFTTLLFSQQCHYTMKVYTPKDDPEKPKLRIDLFSRKTESLHHMSSIISVSVQCPDHHVEINVMTLSNP